MILKRVIKSEIGLSIKSKLGGRSTLFNANKTTNIIYKIDDLSAGMLSEINQPYFANKTKATVQFLIKKLQDSGCKLVFTPLKAINLIPIFKCLNQTFP